MNLQTFLESGLLESYALRQCAPEEVALVEKMLAEHEAARTELHAIELALEEYTKAHAVAPPKWLKGKIMDEIAKTPPPSGPTGGNHLFRHPLTWVMGALVLTTALLWFNSYQQNNLLRGQIAQSQQDAAACLTQQQELQQEHARQTDFLLHPGTKKIKINWVDPTLAASSGTAIAFDNPELRATYLQVSGLPDPGPGKDYQLWVITKTSPNPVPLKVFQRDSKLIRMDYHPEALNFAISIEQDGGSKTGVPATVVGAG